MLNQRELATVLAALRHWQCHLATDGSPAPAYSFQLDETDPHSIEEIDALCERLNVGAEICECELPGYFQSGLPGIIAHMQDGQLATDAKVERCDLCRRYPSDDAASQKLVELGLTRYVHSIETIPPDRKETP